MSVFDQAFDIGHKAALAGEPSRSNPSFWKGLISPKYLDQHTKGYQAGYNTGLKDKRYQEMYQARQSQWHTERKNQVHER